MDAKITGYAVTVESRMYGMPSMIVTFCMSHQVETGGWHRKTCLPWSLRSMYPVKHACHVAQVE
jgi:hypothetical protein